MHSRKWLLIEMLLLMVETDARNPAGDIQEKPGRLFAYQREPSFVDGIRKVYSANSPCEAKMPNRTAMPRLAPLSLVDRQLMRISLERRGAYRKRGQATSKETMANMKRFAQNATLLFSVCAIMILISELFLGFFFGDVIRPARSRYDDSFLNNTPYLMRGINAPFQLRKNYKGTWSNKKPVSTNEHGMRSPVSVPARKQVDVIFMGDSFTFGYLVGDEETYSYYVRHLLQKRGAKTSVANAGYASGFSYDSAYVRYRHYFHKFKPKTIVFGLFPGNDYTNARCNLWTKTDQNGYPLRIQRFRDHMYRDRLYEVPILSESRIFMALGSMISKAYYGECEQNVGAAEQWRKNDLVIKAFGEITRKHGVRLYFVFLPEPLDGFSSYLVKLTQASRPEYKLSDYKKESDGRNDRMKRTLSRNGIPYWDFASGIALMKSNLKNKKLPSLRSEFRDFEAGSLKSARAKDWAPNKILASPDGIHYSQITNLFLAQWLYERLSRAGGLE